MGDRAAAEQLNEAGHESSERDEPAAAESAYRNAIAADPEWSVPYYNLGLLCKYQGRWAESAEMNARACALSPDDEAAWWNLGIAATALCDWREARRAWRACGVTVDDGDDPPAHPHCGLAALDAAQAEAILARWLEQTGADVIKWYVAPRGSPA